MKVTAIQFVHSNTTIPESLLHSITHITHVLLTQICSIVSFGDKHQSPEDGDSLKKKDGSLQSSKSTVISSEQPETRQIYIDAANTPSSCYWSVSNLQKAQLASRTCISSLIIVRTCYSGQSFLHKKYIFQMELTGGCGDVIARFLCLCSSGWPRTWALAVSGAWCILRGEEFPLIWPLCFVLLQFLPWSIANFNFNVLKRWPYFPNWILAALHEPDEEAPCQISAPAWTFHLPSAARWFSESAMGLLYVLGGHLEYFNCNNTSFTAILMVYTGTLLRSGQFWLF